MSIGQKIERILLESAEISQEAIHTHGAVANHIYTEFCALITPLLEAAEALATDPHVEVILVDKYNKGGTADEIKRDDASLARFYACRQAVCNARFVES